MTSPKERMSILKEDVNAYLRRVAQEKYQNRLTNEIISLVRRLRYEDQEKIKRLEDLEKFPYTEFRSIQDSEGKVWMGYAGSSIVKKVGLPMIVPDVYYAVRETLLKDPKHVSVIVNGPVETNLFRPAIDFEEEINFLDCSTLKISAQSPRGIRNVNLEIVENKEFQPDFWELDKFVGVGNMDLTPISQRHSQ